MVNDRKTRRASSPGGCDPRRQHRKRHREREADQRYRAVDPAGRRAGEGWRTRYSAGCRKK